MKGRISFFCTLLCLPFLIIPAYTQEVREEAGVEKEKTIEELYLQSIEIKIIMEQAQSESREMKLLALQNIKNMIESGDLSTGSPEAHYVLDYLSQEGITREIREGGRRLVNYYPDIRREACSLLGDLGGENSRATLLRVLAQDIEPMVKAEAAYALGKIGEDENGEVARALANVILSQDNRTSPDNNLAFAVCLAIEKLAKANNGINNESVFRALIEISQGSYIKAVRTKANSVLDELRNYR
ncbi:MAG: HEAT repeat domain-containing protein [Spirochaetes bacterium]|nr:MAG: HEAT repeat domain-containing protein [Spirochaetota bacterium]